VNRYTIEDSFSQMEGSIKNIIIMDCTNYPNTILVENSKSNNILFEKGIQILNVR
jgi:hypothetical protein